MNIQNSKTALNFTFSTIKMGVAKYCSSCFYQSSWQCYGAGEIGCEVFFVNPLTQEREFVYSLSGDNGQNTFYNPSGEAWVEQMDENTEMEFAEAFVDSLSASEIYALYTKMIMSGCNITGYMNS